MCVESLDLPWIVTVTHGHLGVELVKSGEMLLGKVTHVKSISLLPEESPEELASIVESELQDIPKGSLILTDLFGGTPSNVTAIFAKKGYGVITGMNLPLFLEAEMLRSNGHWDDAVKYLTKIGKDSVINVNEQISKK